MANQKDYRIRIVKNGPYLLTGCIPLSEEIIEHSASGSAYVIKRRFASRNCLSLCRCGRSRQKPFCDGTHQAARFDGTETASHEPYCMQAERYDGPELRLEDNKILCSLARFCHPGNSDVWDLTEQPCGADCREVVIKAVGNCPSGRLVVYDQATGQVIEPEFEPSVAVIQDPEKHCSGPLFVRGGIPVESEDGTVYEIRNRVTLCRCGESANKPFCDATHLDIGFNDRDSSPEG